MKSIVFVTALICVSTSDVMAFQSPFDAQTPNGLQQGGPPAYALSGFDSVNFFNQSVGVAIPLLQIGGRGEAGYTMSIPLNYTWQITYNPSTTDFDFAYGGFSDPDNAYRPASIIARKGGTGTQPGCSSAYDKTLTRLSVQLASGGTIEFRDAVYNGEPQTPTGPGCATNRGSTWVSVDGSAATFVADTDILDVVHSGDAFIEYPSGTLYLRNGVKYYFTAGKIQKIVDRNGNKVTFTPLELTGGDTACGSGLRISDPLERHTDVLMGCPWPEAGVGWRRIRTTFAIHP